MMNLRVCTEDELRTMLVDFDWCGKDGMDWCPFGLNIFIDWPDRVALGGIIRKEA
jgi:hypothetical protein